MSVYLLIRQLPGTDRVPGEITACSGVFSHPMDAKRSAAVLLSRAANIPIGVANAGARVLKRPVGTVWEHEFGYRFRILKANHTDNGVPITPGLRVRGSDNWWGIVHPGQFLATGLLDPGGAHFDGFYFVHREGDTNHGVKYNGERMSTEALRYFRSGA